MANETHTSDDILRITFSWYDYALFSISLSLSALIGVYFGFIKKQSTADDYLLGGREMKVWPIAMSLIASSISGVVLLAVPADIYRFGVTYWLSTPIMIISVLVSCYAYIPVFYKLQITSIYEYFELRFDARTRTFSSFLFTSCMILYLPIVIYIPALALSQATGLNTHLITPVVCGICIFYTTVGGLKAVVWTDALQLFIMLGATIVVFIMGVILTGGFDAIWKRSLEGGRLHIDFDLDITKRDTFWSATFGASVMFLCLLGINQGFVQKCIALPTYKHVKQSLFIFTVGIMLFLSFSIFTGLIMFAKYYDCDPLTSGKIKRPDQLLPYYIMDVARSIPGLPGLFIAGVFSASLSTLSAVMNCLAGTVYEDFISPYTSKNISQERVSTILKLLVVIIGVISTCLVFVIENLGSLLPLAFSLPGITAGPLLGLFTVGMTIPLVNGKGAFCGGVVSLLIMGWIVLGSQWYQSHGYFHYTTLPLSVKDCGNLTNISSTSISTSRLDVNKSDPFFLYKMSYYYYYITAVSIVFLVSIPISLLTRTKNASVNKDCITPIMQFLLPKDSDPPDYYSLDKALTVVTTNNEEK